ncbi:sodium-dependent transporter [Arcanobacterium phocisimile]|uniref:Transporter n=1 Tax=Arcanobacterium phocisimile TaxID=1302235 RepID=A0ABX7IFV0_9ACTO|nr:sodium-dependent transporter [Arcanobacterium phocisimile]QRV01927.1 sodium-dependent transporter [Arcanobacterium phocisimile]
MSTTTGREVWSSRTVFLAAAVGSAIGLGNIWRFPYIAYENGGGSFLIPYVIALVTGGISMLFFDYAIGHRFRGAPPLAFRRVSKHAEALGWVQTLVTFFIAVYYMAILAWAGFYTYYSVTLAWGDDPEAFFLTEFLQLDGTSVFTGGYLPGLTVVLAVIWLVLLFVMSKGVEHGVGQVSKLAVPLLIVLFLAITVRAVFLPGASAGLDTLFTPDWSALLKPSVWMAGYGQIFYSLAVGFGIMLTQASYLKRRTDVTTTAWTVAFANSSFEVLAGIGVFSVLGYMAMNSGQEVGDVVSSGIGLAFIAFPKIISLMPGGALFGVLFFGSLFLAGFTSMFSIIEVPISAAMDKFGWARRKAVLVVGGLAALISVGLLPTTTGLATLDIMDKFINVFGIVAIALVTLVVVGWGMKMFPVLSRHLDAISTIPTRGWWVAAVGVLTPFVLAVTLVGDTRELLTNPYGGYTTMQLLVYGWGLALLIWVLAFVLSYLPWVKGTQFEAPAEFAFDLDKTEQMVAGKATGGAPAAVAERAEVAVQAAAAEQAELTERKKEGERA